MRHILIGCSQTKAATECPAIAMYRGALFARSLEWAAMLGYDKLWILSAKFGLLAPAKVIEPYELTLNSAATRRAWTTRATREIIRATAEGDELIVLAGAQYIGWRSELVIRGRRVVTPLAGKGIGTRKQWLAQEVDRMRGHKPMTDADRDAVLAVMAGRS